MGIHCTVVTPEATALEKEAELVVVPLMDGEIGIQEKHSPLIGRIGYGEMRITADGSVSKFYVDGGFVQVADNKVSVITNRAVPASDINLATAESQLAEAEKLIAVTVDESAAKDKALQRARAQIRMAKS